MEDRPEHLSDLARMGADIRTACRRCGFEEDWTPDALGRHLAETGGSEIWSEVTRHLRCRSFGCGSTGLTAQPVPRDRRSANMSRRIGRLDANLLAAALGVLDAAARRSRGQAVASIEIRLALLVVHRYARDRDCVRDFWSRASTGDRTADEGLARPIQVIRQRLVSSGWLAPSRLPQPAKTWPWECPAPAGWIDPTRPDAAEHDAAGPPEPGTGGPAA